LVSARHIDGSGEAQGQRRQGGLGLGQLGGQAIGAIIGIGVHGCLYLGLFELAGMAQPAAPARLAVAGPARAPASLNPPAQIGGAGVARHQRLLLVAWDFHGQMRA
jgi:hypothetical protein